MQGRDIELHNGSMAMQLVQINNLMRDFKTEAQRRRRCKSMKGEREGAFLVSAKNAFVPVKRVYSMNTFSRISTIPQGSEQSE